jgi:hypothetical protein
VTRGVRLAQHGRFEETVALLTDTRHRLRGHPVAAAAPVLPGVLANLGLAQILCGRYGQADDHLREARALARERRLPLMDLVVRQNQGCLDLHRGDSVSAIGTFLDLRHRLPVGRREALHVDLAEALLAEGLVEEAANALHEGPWTDDAASPAALLVEAKLRLLDGSPSRAVELTRRVRRSNGVGSLWHRLATRLEHMALRNLRAPVLTWPASMTPTTGAMHPPSVTGVIGVIGAAKTAATATPTDAPSAAGAAAAAGGSHAPSDTSVTDAAKTAATAAPTDTPSAPGAAAAAGGSHAPSAPSAVDATGVVNSAIVSSAAAAAGESDAISAASATSAIGGNAPGVVSAVDTTSVTGAPGGASGAKATAPAALTDAIGTAGAAAAASGSHTPSVTGVIGATGAIGGAKATATAAPTDTPSAPGAAAAASGSHAPSAPSAVDATGVVNSAIAASATTVADTADAVDTTGAGAPIGPVAWASDALALRAPLASPEIRRRDRTSRRALRTLALGTATAPGAWAGPATADPHVVRAGLERALLHGDAATALEWADLGRTWAVPLVPGPLAPRSAALSVLTERYRDALARGTDPRACARRWEMERWRSLYTTGPAPRVHTAPMPVVPALADRLAGRAFAHLVRASGDLVAIVATSARVRARTLGPFRQAARTLARFAHEAQRSPGGPTPAGDAVHALLAPVLSLVGDRALVLAADPALGDPPWGMLPALCGRTLSLVPTARFWVERSAPPPPPRRVLLVAGAEPAGARAEVDALAALHPGARVLTGARARPHDVLAGFGSADLVHLAAHGRVPDDAPLLASVELPHGPLLACDLRDAPAAPAVVVLSTCWSGRGFAAAPGLPSGFVGALLARGTRTVVASPVPVEDAATGAAMRAFHRALVAGTPVPEAVALHLGRSGFCCFGA